MNDTTEPTDEKTTGEMADLLTGQASFLKKIRLRRQLRHDTKKAEEFAALKQLRDDMRFLGTATDIPPAPTWFAAERRPLSEPLLHLGGITMKRKTAAIACAALFLTVTGAVAARQWLTYGTQAVIGDKQGHNWNISTKIPVSVTIYDNQNQLAGVFRNEDNGPASGPVTIRVAGEKRAFDTPGRHTVEDAKGNLIGAVVIAPLNDRDRAEMSAEDKQAHDDLAPLYNRDFFFPIRGGGANGKDSSIGVVTSYDMSAGIAYKIIGYAQVQEKSASGVLSGATSGTFPSEETLRKMRPEAAQSVASMKSLAPSLTATPEIYVTFAAKDANGKYSLKDAWWSAVKKTERATGYGIHPFRDETGKTILTLDVKPLEPPAPAP